MISIFLFIVFPLVTKHEFIIREIWVKICRSMITNKHGGTETRREGMKDEEEVDNG